MRVEKLCLIIPNNCFPWFYARRARQSKWQVPKQSFPFIMSGDNGERSLATGGEEVRGDDEEGMLPKEK